MGPIGIQEPLLILLLIGGLVFWLWILVDCATKESVDGQHQGRLDHNNRLDKLHRRRRLLAGEETAATGRIGSIDPCGPHPPQRLGLEAHLDRIPSPNPCLVYLARERRLSTRYQVRLYFLAVVYASRRSIFDCAKGAG